MPHSYDRRDVIYPQIELQVQCNPDQYNRFYVELNKHSKRFIEIKVKSSQETLSRRKKMDLL